MSSSGEDATPPSGTSDGCLRNERKAYKIWNHKLRTNRKSKWSSEFIFCDMISAWIQFDWFIWLSFGVIVRHLYGLDCHFFNVVRIVRVVKWNGIDGRSNALLEWFGRRIIWSRWLRFVVGFRRRRWWWFLCTECNCVWFTECRMFMIVFVFMFIVWVSHRWIRTC